MTSNRDRVVNVIRLIKELENEMLSLNAIHLIKELENEMLSLLQEVEVRELTMDEWQKWKKDPNRDPICQVYYDDSTPFWVLDPNEVNEVLYYAGKIKLFTKKPEKWQVKWK